MFSGFLTCPSCQTPNPRKSIGILIDAKDVVIHGLKDYIKDK